MAIEFDFRCVECGIRIVSSAPCAVCVCGREMSRVYSAPAVGRGSSGEPSRRSL